MANVLKEMEENMKVFVFFFSNIKVYNNIVIIINRIMDGYF